MARTPETKVKFSIFNKEFNDGIREMKNESALLRKEFTLQDQQLKQTGSAAERLSLKVKHLGDQQGIVQKQIQATSQQLDKAKVTYGENSNEANKLSNKLLDLQISEQKLSNAINATQQELNQQNSTMARYGQEMSRLKTESSLLTKEFDLQEAQLQQTGSEADQLTLKMQRYSAQQDVVKREIQATNNALQSAKSEYGANSNEANKLSSALLDLQVKEQKLSNSIASVKSDLSKQSQSFSESKSAAERYAQTLNDVGEKMKGIGEITQGPSLGAAAGGGLAAKTAIDVDAAERLIIASIGGTAEQAKVLKEDFRAVYRDGFGDGPEDIARAMAMVKNNIQGVNEGRPLQQATKDALVLAQVTDSDVGEVTRGVNQLMHNFGLTSQEAFDMFAKGNQRGLNFSQEMFDNISEYAPLFKQMGFSADEYFSILENGTKNGAYNLDYVNDIMKEFDIRLRDGSKLTNDSMAQMSENTQNLFEQFKQGKVSTEDMFKAVIPELQNMDDQVTANQIGVGLFGTKFEDMGAKSVYALDDMNNAFKNSKGTMDEVSKTINESFGSKLQTTLRQLGLAIEPIGKVLLDMLMSVTPAIENFAKWFENLNPVIQTVIGVFTGLLAILGPIFTMIGMAFTFISPLVTAFTEWAATSVLVESALALVSSALALISGPVLAVIAVITALVGVFIYLWNTSESFRNACIEIWNSIVEVVMTVVQSVVDFVMQIWGMLVTWWQENNQLIMDTIMTVWNFISPFIMGVVTAIVGVIMIAWTTISTVTQVTWNGIVTIVQVVWTIITTAIQVATTIILGIITLVMQLITGNWQGAWNTILNIVTTVWNLMWSAISTILNLILSFIMSVLSSIASFIGGVFNGILVTITGILRAILGAIFSIFNMILSFVISVWNGIKNAVVNAAQAVYSGVQSKFDQILSTARNIFEQVKSAITNPIETAKNTVLGIIDKIVSAFANMRITIPKPKLPHISVGSKSVGVGKASVDIPTFGIEWYKKGGFFSRPAIAGNAGFGDVNEAIIPFEGPHASYFANLIGSAMNRQLGLTKDEKVGGGQIQNFNINFTGYIREEADVEKVSAQLAREMRRKERGG
ncbi:phage tail tape measure protein [Macrococcus capreoli]